MQRPRHVETAFAAVWHISCFVIFDFWVWFHTALCIQSHVSEIVSMKL